MNKIFRVGIKYCGGCNPYIERKKLVQAVQEKLKPDSVQFVGYGEKNLDLLFNVSGCRIDCVGQFEVEEKVPKITVAGKIFNYRQWEWEDLVERITEEIRTQLAALGEDKGEGVQDDSRQI
ncbi:MAG TPA: hypothetical protein GXX38_03695 [Clostridia bacterium]|nr:hypothetical protein [Clostridia bacterium]